MRNFDIYNSYLRQTGQHWPSTFTSSPCENNEENTDNDESLFSSQTKRNAFAFVFVGYK